MMAVRRLMIFPMREVCFRRQIHTARAAYSSDIVENNFYNDEHRAVQATLSKIIDKYINPFVDEWEKKEEFPGHEILKILGEASLLGANKSTEYGGLGLNYIYDFAINETLGKIRSAAVGQCIAVHKDMATIALARFGSDALKRQFLAPSISGDQMAALAVSESGAGSDVSGISTNAIRNGDDLIINGSKMWITNAFQADWICLLANTGQGNVHHNKSLICVPMNTPGIHLAKKIDKLGLRSSDTGLIYFEDVRVPYSYIIGEEGKGFTYQMQQFQHERLSATTVGLDTLFRCIQTTIDYCRERKTFGQPILHNQYVQFRLAELATDVEAHRALLYQTAKLYAEGHDVTKWTSMCKLNAGRLVRRVADTCLQYWGGMGFTNEVKISRVYRDGRAMSIAGGSDEVMLMIISKYMNMMSKDGKKKA